jgi:MFS family permease
MRAAGTGDAGRKRGSRSGVRGDGRERGGLPSARAGYQWVALSNTTLAMMIITIDGSIMIIALPTIFRGIGLDPFAAGNIGYLPWLIMGYLVAQAVLVVSLGRLGDMYGRVRVYNLGFAVFSGASGMRSTFQNSGTPLSSGIFFSLMITGLAGRLPAALTTGLHAQRVPLAAATKIAHLPP